MKMSLVGRLFPVIQPFLRLRVFNELAVFSEEKKNETVSIGSRVTLETDHAKETLAGLNPHIVH
jgi:hypothetical protein